MRRSRMNGMKVYGREVFTVVRRRPASFARADPFGLIGLGPSLAQRRGLGETPRLKAAQTRPHHTPVFAIDAQGSAGAFVSPFWMSSIEMLSGVRMKAMWPSRGGRLMVTPAALSLAQVA